MAKPKAPYTDLVRSLPAELTIAEMGEHVRANGFPNVKNQEIYSVRAGADLDYKRVLPRRAGFKYPKRKKPTKVTAKNKPGPKPKQREPETAAEAMAVIRAAKQASSQPRLADMEAAMRKFVMRYGTEHIRAFLDRLDET